MAICLHNPSCQEFLIQLIDDDEAEPMIQLLGQDKLLAKTEHYSAYRLLPIYPSDFHR